MNNTKEKRLKFKLTETKYTPTVDISISPHGSLNISERFSISDLMPPPVIFDSKKSKSRLRRMNRSHLPVLDINYLIGLKKQIQDLTAVERPLSSTGNLIFKQMLFDIKNLFRIVSAEVLDIHQQTRPKQTYRPNPALKNNLEKLRYIIRKASSYHG